MTEEGKFSVSFSCDFEDDYYCDGIVAHGLTRMQADTVATVLRCSGNLFGGVKVQPDTGIPPEAKRCTGMVSMWQQRTTRGRLLHTLPDMSAVNSQNSR